MKRPCVFGLFLTQPLSNRRVMKLTTRIAACVMLFLGISAFNVAQEKSSSEITILVPPAGHAETIIKVNGKVIDGEGGTRKYKAVLEKGKEAKLTIEALIEPNNYTKITRTKSIIVKAGVNAKLDLTIKDKKTDKIVVRWVPTPDDIVIKMGEIAKITKNDIIYDLGCGDAVMLILPIKKFGAKKGVGIDIDPKMIEIAKKKAKEAKLEDKLDLRVGDILNVKDLSDASVVLLYIGDDLGERLSPVLQKTLKPGARIVSHRFTLGDWAPTKTLTVKGEDSYEYELHLWVVGEKKELKKSDKQK
ncbi:MAG: class I SAM-dependent methyltransferase [Gemmataceae bacterium]|nr:class I SAM-dependent methyltransferase [Gemmataceae bacterium]